MDLNLTAVFQAVPQGYIGFVEELPGANSQGATLDEARANLREALILEANRQLLRETTRGDAVIREPLRSVRETAGADSTSRTARLQTAPRRWQAFRVVNPPTGQTSTVPRHFEINDDLARKICNVALPTPAAGLERARSGAVQRQALSPDL
jgi:hypothetical protein